MQKAGTAIAQETTKKAKTYVTSGPHLWVSTLLHHKGALSGNQIWEEYVRDDKADKTLINSKSHLKNKIMPLMQRQGKVQKARAQDLPQFKYSGWKVIPAKAFKRTDPEIIMAMDQPPELDRQDLKTYIQEQYKKLQTKV